jgi:hypothetical protein
LIKKEVITKEQVRAIFSEIEVILGYNKMLLGNLEARMQKWNFYTNLGDIFKRMVCFSPTSSSPSLFIFLISFLLDGLFKGVHTGKLQFVYFYEFINNNSLQYVNNYNSAITTISAVKHVEKVSAFLTVCV